MDSLPKKNNKVGSANSYVEPELREEIETIISAPRSGTSTASDRGLYQSSGSEGSPLPPDCDVPSSAISRIRSGDGFREIPISIRSVGSKIGAKVWLKGEEKTEKFELINDKTDYLGHSSGITNEALVATSVFGPLTNKHLTVGAEGGEEESSQDEIAGPPLSHRGSMYQARDLYIDCEPSSSDAFCMKKSLSYTNESYVPNEANPVATVSEEGIISIECPDTSKNSENVGTGHIKSLESNHRRKLVKDLTQETDLPPTGSNSMRSSSRASRERENGSIIEHDFQYDNEIFDEDGDFQTSKASSTAKLSSVPRGGSDKERLQITQISLETYNNITRNGIKNGNCILWTTAVFTFIVTIVLTVLILIAPKTFATKDKGDSIKFLSINGSHVISENVNSNQTIYKNNDNSRSSLLERGKYKTRLKRKSSS